MVPILVTSILNRNFYIYSVIRELLYRELFFELKKFSACPSRALGTLLYSKRILITCSLRRVVLSRGFRLREEGPLSKTLPFYSAFRAALISSLYSRGPNRIRLACRLLFFLNHLHYLFSFNYIIDEPRALSRFHIMPLTILFVS